jgi:hypothetical protein
MAAHVHRMPIGCPLRARAAAGHYFYINDGNRARLLAEILQIDMA